MSDTSATKSLSLAETWASNEPGWKQKHLPRIDYDQHPAYGGMLPKPTLGQRARALALFAKAFGYTSVRRLIDYETLPILSKDPAKPVSKANFAMRYMANIAKVSTSRALKRVAGQRKVAAADPAMLDSFQRDGFLTARFDPKDVARIAELCGPAFDTLRKRRSAIPLEKRKFDDNMHWLSRSDSPEAYAHITSILEKAGVMAVASAYLGRPVAVKHVNPQLNDDADTFWKRQFPDANIADPPTTFMHVDTTYSLLKFMFYLTPLTKDADGPFSYVRGSNNARVSGFEGLVRRANEYAGLSSKKPDKRAMFMALPKLFRKKCDFGNDMSGSADAGKLVGDEVKFFTTSADGILFVPNGIHRGGMVHSGERLVVTVLLTEM